MLEKMKAMVRKKDTCVLATASDNKPHCSLMAYVSDDECRKIYMVTHKQTRKYRNLLENPYVSLLIDTRDEDTGQRRLAASALTASGVYEKLEDQQQKDFIRGRLLEKHPHLKEFASDPDAEVLSVKVTSFLLLQGVTNAYFEALS